MTVAAALSKKTTIPFQLAQFAAPVSPNSSILISTSWKDVTNLTTSIASGEWEDGYQLEMLGLSMDMERGLRIVPSSELEYLGALTKQHPEMVRASNPND